MFGGVVVSLSDDIVKVLENNPRCQFNAKTVDRFLQKKDYKKDSKRIAKIRTELKRLSDRKKINRKKRGFYQAKPLPHVLQKLENPEVKIHGIKIEINLVENNTKHILPISTENNIFEDWLDSRGFDPISFNRWKVVKWWEEKKITFTVHSKGLCEIFVNASSCPFVFQDWIRFLNWVDGFFDPLLFDHKMMWVRQVGFNRDFRLLRLEGVSSVSVQVMTNLWSQVYQKDNGLVRFEHHMVFPEMCVNVDDVARSLMMLTVPLAKENGSRPDERRDVV